MRDRWLCLVPCLVLVASCQPAPEVPAGPEATPTYTLPASESTSSPLAPWIPGEGSFGYASLQTWMPPSTSAVGYDLPVDLGEVGNLQVLNGLADGQLAFLAQNGFAMLHTREAQFMDIRQAVSRDHGQPYYLTTDAAFHALHLAFDDLLKALERERLRPEMMALTRAALGEVLGMLPELEGTPAEADTRQAAAYLSVALRLFDPEAALDPSLEDLVLRQVEQVMGYSGRENSSLFPDFEDDYGAYRPVGHYAADHELEQYFRGMTWFGRVHFAFQDPERVPSRLPLVVTLALRRAQVGGQSAAEAWSTIHEVLTFMIGPSDDGGPLELAALMDQVYGLQVDPPALADGNLWQAFLDRSGELPAPRINSTFVDWLADLGTQAGWRFLGQRFTLDGFILQNLVFDAVQDQADGTRRDLPTGLDVMAALGSEAALSALESRGDFQYPNYAEQMDELQAAVGAQAEEEWLNVFYDSWLYAFLPVLSAKGPAYPAYMRTPAWSAREMNSALGSWAELKHDTILYTKMPETAGGGGPPSSGPAPAYVEANPDVFYRLAYAAETLAQGLRVRGLDTSEYERTGDWETGFSLTLQDLVDGMSGLASRLGELGDVAARELEGEDLTDEDYWMIQACLGPNECLVERSRQYGQSMELEPVPVVAAVAGAQDVVLEAAVGDIDRILVVVPLEGELQVAQGGVFSYYEFVQPRSERLTDEAWRNRLAGASAPELPSWTSLFMLPGGFVTEHLAFRVGDVYIVTEEGDNLNLRAEPSLRASILERISSGEYLEVVGGPVQADGHTWWQVGSWGEARGWVVEDQAWYVRAYGQ